MRFVTIRELRNKSAQIQRDLPEVKEMILTSNGKPVAILSSVSEATLEGSLNALRQARAMRAVAEMQTSSVKHGLSRISDKEIDDEIAAERKKRR